LGQLRDIEPQIDKAGFEWVAIAPDTPDMMKVTRAKYNVRARFLSDSQMRAARAFRIAYEVDNATLAQLKSHGIDLEAASGERHHQLPVPAVYAVATNGRIQFAYVNPDYSVRLDPELLLAALRTVRISASPA
jgi:peroxiredoxin